MPLISEQTPGAEELEGVLPAKVKERRARLYPPGSHFAERYEIEILLGTGALGSIYRAVERDAKRQVALKVFHQDLFQAKEIQQRFERFARLAETLQHPGLVKVDRSGMWEEQPYIVRDYVDGQSLDQLIIERKKTKRPFKLQEVLYIFSEIAQTLAAVQTRSFHGALSPTNILVTDERVLVTDLGLARTFPPAQFSSLQIYYGNGYYYLAPEYDLAGAKLDHRADLYAAAVIAYEMLTGEIPRSPIMPPSAANAEVPPGLDGPFLKALDLNPESRQENLAHFVEQLRGLSGLLEYSATSAGLAAEETLEPAVPISGVLKEPEAPRELLVQAKSRISEAIDRQLQAHGAPATSLTLETRTPFLPSNGAVKAPPAVVEPLFTISKSNARADEASRSSEGKLWPWFIVVIAGAFAVLVWANLLPRFRKNTDTVLIPVAVKASEEIAAPRIVKPKPPAHPPVARQEEASVVGEVAVVHQGGGQGNTERPFLPGQGSTASGGSKGKKGIRSGSKSAALASGAIAMRNSCPGGMAFIPAGSFIYGNPRGDRDFLEYAGVTANLTGFCIDFFEWPNRAGGKPETRISYVQAATACGRAGKRLCTEREWERACKGPAQSQYTYGDAFRSSACNTKDGPGPAQGMAAMSGAYSSCKNAWGVYDMSGNVAEWTTGALGRGKPDRIVRGGSFHSSGWGAHCAVRKNRLPTTQTEDIGFRCCRSLGESNTL